MCGLRCRCLSVIRLSTNHCLLCQWFLKGWGPSDSVFSIFILPLVSLPGKPYDRAQPPSHALLENGSPQSCVICLLSPQVPRGGEPRETPRSKAPQVLPLSATSFFHPHRSSTMARLALAPLRRPSKSSLTRDRPTSGCPPPSAAPSTQPVVSPSPLPACLGSPASRPAKSLLLPCAFFLSFLCSHWP